jgi:hypothetical protein
MPWLATLLRKSHKSVGELLGIAEIGPMAEGWDSRAFKVKVHAKCCFEEFF